MYIIHVMFQLQAPKLSFHFWGVQRSRTSSYMLWAYGKRFLMGLCYRRMQGKHMFMYTCTCAYMCICVTTVYMYIICIHSYTCSCMGYHAHMPYIHVHLHVHLDSYLYIHVRCNVYLCLFQNGTYRGDIELRVNNLLQAAYGLAFLHSSDGGLSVVTHGDVKAYVCIKYLYSITVRWIFIYSALTYYLIAILWPSWGTLVLLAQSQKWREAKVFGPGRCVGPKAIWLLKLL